MRPSFKIKLPITWQTHTLWLRGKFGSSLTFTGSVSEQIPSSYIKKRTVSVYECNSDSFDVKLNWVLEHIVLWVNFHSMPHIS